MVEVIEQPDGFVVCSGQFRETFRRKAYALLAANMLATAEAILHDRDVEVLLPMGNGETVMRVECAARH